MKFGKRLKQQIEETLPEWRDKFLSYKELKQRIKAVSNALATAEDPPPPPFKRRRVSDRSKRVEEEESAFINLLNAEIDKFNAFFVEQEEEYIIRQKVLQDRISSLKQNRDDNSTFSKAEYSKETLELRKDIVNLHGEMVLLQNYSSLNYMGVTKILKKFDKRTGGLLRHPFIQKVLEQPFFTTEQLSKLIRECENTLQNLFADYSQEESSCSTDTNGKSNQPEGKKQTHDHHHKQPGSADPNAKEDEENGVEIIQRSIVAALQTLREIRKGSSTYSMFSLPPLPTSTSSGADDGAEEGRKPMPTVTGRRGRNVTLVESSG